jgi:hypothetical protein
VSSVTKITKMSGGDYFCGSALVLALLGHDGDFVELRYDGRRFEPVDV